MIVCIHYGQSISVIVLLLAFFYILLFFLTLLLLYFILNKLLRLLLGPKHARLTALQLVQHGVADVLLSLLRGRELLRRLASSRRLKSGLFAFH